MIETVTTIMVTAKVGKKLSVKVVQNIGSGRSRRLKYMFLSASRVSSPAGPSSSPLILPTTPVPITTTVMEDDFPDRDRPEDLLKG